LIQVLVPRRLLLTILLALPSLATKHSLFYFSSLPYQVRAAEPGVANAIANAGAVSMAQQTQQPSLQQQMHQQQQQQQQPPQAIAMPQQQQQQQQQQQYHHQQQQMQQQQMQQQMLQQQQQMQQMTATMAASQFGATGFQTNAATAPQQALANTRSPWAAPPVNASTDWNEGPLGYDYASYFRPKADVLAAPRVYQPPVAPPAGGFAGGPNAPGFTTQDPLSQTNNYYAQQQAAATANAVGGGYY
jgi:hypothetical protein